MTRHLWVGLLVITGLTTPCTKSFSQANHSPLVKIVEPQNKSKYDINSQIQYRIKISDKEDGESEYGEIATNEVFLEVRYLPDPSQMPNPAPPDPDGLAAMKKSNCFTCHAFNGKLIAPSFYEITKRYPPTDANKELLASRIKNGSGGVWGSASMPSHSEMTTQQVQEIANWILKNGTDANLNYFVGPEGTFKMKRPDKGEQKGAYTLSATYSDHGGLTSKDMIIIYMK
jgi:cytochrome c